MGNKNKPELRFKGFTEEWEKRELNEVAKFNPKHEIPDVFNYVDLESVVGTEMISYRKECKISAPSRAQRQAEKGDVFYQTVRPYQKNNLLFDREDKDFVFSTGYAQMRPVIESSFLFTLIQKDEFVRVVLNNCTGTSYPAINSTVLASIKQYFPKSKTEQTQIGNFFENIDKLITEHQQKHSKLKALKQAMLSKMFPKPGQTVPEIRFKGFEGDWEEKRLRIISSLITKGTTPLDKSNFGEISFVKIENINSENGSINITSKISIEEHNGYLLRSQLQEGDILFSIAGTLGRVAIIPRQILPANTNQALAIIRLKDINVDYVATYLKGKGVKDFVRRNPTVGAQPNLSLEQIGNIEIPLPKYEEQKLIGNYFKNIDELISNHDTQITKLQNIKKAFLAKMFV